MRRRSYGGRLIGVRAAIPSCPEVIAASHLDASPSGRERTLAGFRLEPPQLLDQRGQRLAVDKLHGVVVHAALAADRVVPARCWGDAGGPPPCASFLNR